MLGGEKQPFMLAAVPSIYWGRSVMTIHIDGVLSPQTITELENHIVAYTGIPVERALPQKEQEQVSATRFAQLLVAWRFLELVNHRLHSSI